MSTQAVLKDIKFQADAKTVNRRMSHAESFNLIE